MNPAAAAILEGMPDPTDLRRDEHDGMTFICAGSALLACYPSGDAGMRNVAVAVLRQLGFGGRTVAAVMGLTENYVATLHNRALREGTPGWCAAGDGPASWPRATGSRRPGGGRRGLRTARSPAGCGSPSPRCSAAWARPPCRSSCPPPGRTASRSRRPGRRRRSRTASPGCGQASRGRAGPPDPGRTMNRRRPGRGRRPAPRCHSPHPRPPAAWSRRAGGSRRRAPGWPGSPAARCPAGMRGRCWPTPTSTGSARRRSWRPRCRPPWPGRGTTTWGC